MTGDATTVDRVGICRPDVVVSSGCIQYARVAEWQTRWLQVPVPVKGVEVQLLSRAQ